MDNASSQFGPATASQSAQCASPPAIAHQPIHPPPAPNAVVPPPEPIAAIPPPAREIVRPDGEKELSELFVRADLWQFLANDESLWAEDERENSPWLKGLEGKIAKRWFLSLADNGAVIGHIIDFIIQKWIGRDNGNGIRYLKIDDIDNFVNDTKFEGPKVEWAFKDSRIVLGIFHLYQCHWALAIADLTRKRIEVMDPQNARGDDTAKFSMAGNLLWMLQMMAEGKNEEIGKRREWEIEVNLAVPQQADNSQDCGIYALLFARHIIEGRNEMNFGIENVAYFRRLFAEFIFGKREKGVDE